MGRILNRRMIRSEFQITQPSPERRPANPGGPQLTGTWSAIGWGPSLAI